MSEMSPEQSFPREVLVDKDLQDMTIDEQIAWYAEYMKTVPEENVMMMSGMQIEREADSEAFRSYVTAHQQLIRQGLV